MQLIEKIDEFYEQRRLASLNEDIALSEFQNMILDNMSFRIKDPTDNSKFYSKDVAKDDPLADYIKKRLLEELIKFTGIIENNEDRIEEDEFLLDAHLVVYGDNGNVFVKYHTKSPLDTGSRSSYENDKKKGDHIYIGKDMFNLFQSHRVHRGLQTQEKVLGERFSKTRKDLMGISKSTSRNRKILIDRFIRVTQRNLDNLSHCATEFYDICDNLGFDKKDIVETDLEEVLEYAGRFDKAVGKLSNSTKRYARRFHKTSDCGKFVGLFYRLRKDIGNIYTFLDLKLMRDIENQLGYKDH